MSDAPRRPHVLLITADQLRCDALGCYGNGVVRTPHIDRLADHGTRFDRAFVASPVCGPNRGSIATGRYPSIHGLHRNGAELPGTERTLMQCLREHGFFTCGAGKMHFHPQWRFPPGGGPLKDPVPELAFDPQPSASDLPWYGFDRVVVSEDHRVGPYADYLAEHGLDIWADPHSFSYPQHQCVRSAWPEEHHQTTWIADRAIDFIDRHDPARPMFCWCSFVHPHHPFNPPAPFDTMYDPDDMPPPSWREGEPDGWPEAYRRKYFAKEGGHEAIGMSELTDGDWRRIKAFYYGMVSLIDKQVGRLVAALESRGMLGDTVIVFTSDHGEMLGDHHLVFKSTTFDQVIRTPLIVAEPGRRGAGVDGALSSTIDLMPTVLAMAGVPVPAGVQGRALLGAGASDRPARDALLIETPGPTRVVRTAHAQLSWHGPDQRGELYDLTRDPRCFDNLWDRPEAAALQDDLMRRLVGLLAENVDPLPQPVGAC